jgi:hypothetical protein
MQHWLQAGVTILSMPDEVVTQPRWLLLVHQLPARPSNLRVHVWRRLQHVRAVPLRNSLYVLPHTAEAREDFDWIRTEIVDRGGQASILAAQAIDGHTDDDLEAAFRSARAAEYQVLTQRLEGLAKRVASKRQRLSRAQIQRDLMKAREQWRALKATDFFAAPGSAHAQAAFERLEQLAEPPASGGTGSDHLEPRFFLRRVWVTRPHPGIDRMASAWLIRRFIAPDATFAFSTAPGRDQIPFDMSDVEFGHHGTECTYETLCRRFAISDPAALRIGQLVHDLDLKESRYAIPETVTIGALVEGLRDTASTHAALLEDGIRLIGALHRSFVRDSERPTPARRDAAQGGRNARRQKLGNRSGRPT